MDDGLSLASYHEEVISRQRPAFMSAASIPGTSDTLVSLLKLRLELLLGPTRDGYDVQLFRSAQYTGTPTSTVSLLLYRVDVDEARRYGDSPVGSPSIPSARWLGLELSYLLTVWGQNSASGEQRMLQHCMEILQEFAIVQGSWLSPSYSWEPDDALRISLAPAAWPAFAVNPGDGSLPQGGVGLQHRVITIELDLNGSRFWLDPLFGAN